MAYQVGVSNAIEAYTTGMPPVKSLSAVSATGGGTPLDGVVARPTQMMVVSTSAGVSSGSVQLQGSLDKVNWYSLGSAVSTTSASTTSTVLVTNSLARYVRADIATIISGGTVTAWVAVSG